MSCHPITVRGALIGEERRRVSRRKPCQTLQDVELLIYSMLVRTVQSPWKQGLSLLLKLIMMLAGAGAALRVGPDPKEGDKGERTEGSRVSAA